MIAIEAFSYRYFFISLFLYVFSRYIGIIGGVDDADAASLYPSIPVSLHPS